MTPDSATAYCALVHRKTTGGGDDFPCSRRVLHAHAGRYASVSNGCQEGTWRDGVVPQKTLLSFTDVPKSQTLIPLKSHKTEVNETLFAASVPMTKEADTRVLPAHVENGGDTSGTRWLADRKKRHVLSRRHRQGPGGDLRQRHATPKPAVRASRPASVGVKAAHTAVSLRRFGA